MVIRPVRTDKMGSIALKPTRISLERPLLARIFISYLKQTPQPTTELARILQLAGHTVWWDTNLFSGEAFREAIDRELDAADVVIVIWTDESIKSNWVLAEADHAYRAKKLIPLRAPTYHMTEFQNLTLRCTPPAWKITTISLLLLSTPCKAEVIRVEG